MLIGVVSDTHGHKQYTVQAVRMLEQFDIKRVLHCGDIGSPEIPALFAQWPADFVLGNVDRHDQASLKEAVEATEGHRFHGLLARLNIAEREIAVVHGDDQRTLNELIEDPEVEMVCSGHTHRAEVRAEQDKCVLNPGALFRANPHTFALVDLTALEATIISVGECTR